MKQKLKIRLISTVKICHFSTIHERNQQVLVTEIFKVVTKQVFDFQEPYYNLRSETSQLRRGNIKTTHYDIHYVKFL